MIYFTSDSHLGHEAIISMQNRIKLIGAKGTEIEYKISADKGKVSSFGD